MTTQQRLDCLLVHLDSLAKNQGDKVRLSAQDITLLCEKCGFSNTNEISFYIRSLGERRLIKERCSADNAILEAQISIDGYCYLDSIEG